MVSWVQVRQKSVYIILHLACYMTCNLMEEEEFATETWHGIFRTSLRTSALLSGKEKDKNVMQKKCAPSGLNSIHLSSYFTKLCQSTISLSVRRTQAFSQFSFRLHINYLAGFFSLQPSIIKRLLISKDLRNIALQCFALHNLERLPYKYCRLRAGYSYFPHAILSGIRDGIRSRVQKFPAWHTKAAPNGKCCEGYIVPSVVRLMYQVKSALK